MLKLARWLQTISFQVFLGTGFEWCDPLILRHQCHPSSKWLNASEDSLYDFFTWQSMGLLLAGYSPCGLKDLIARSLHTWAVSCMVVLSVVLIIELSPTQSDSKYYPALYENTRPSLLLELWLLLGRTDLLFYRSRASLHATINAASTEALIHSRDSFGSTGARPRLGHITNMQQAGWGTSFVARTYTAYSFIELVFRTHSCS